MTKFQNIGVFSRHEYPHVLKVLREVISYLKDQGLNIVLESDTAKFLKAKAVTTTTKEELGKNSDLIVAVGGDGNLLSAARMAIDYNVPVVGVNCGKLGFLTDIKPAEIEQKLGEVLKGKYHEEERFLLKAYQEEKEPFCSALNEITLVTETPARMIEFEIYIDDQFFCRQRSNGVIIATPTGSTAYALSAGGPILHPNINAIIIAPILPHTLSNRPVVVNGDRKIRLVLTEKSKAEGEVYADVRFYTKFKRKDVVYIQKMEQPFRLIHPLDYDYFGTLRNKLNWGKELPDNES